MKCATYQIGDVADIVGMSRDTLRYYEKHGLLSPQKGENGYRYYTDSDVQNLISILYQRKMNFGLDKIRFVQTSGCYHDFNTLIANQIAAEEEEIRRHQQTIARLNLTRADFSRFQSDTSSIQMEEMPNSFVIVPQADMQESIRLWFEYSQKYQGLDMMYIYDEYCWHRQGSQVTTEYKNSQLLLHKNLKEFVDYEIPEEPCSDPSPRFCVSTCCISPTRTPDPSLLLPMLDWASSQELIVSQQLFSTFCSQGRKDGQHVWYLQLFIPVF